MTEKKATSLITLTGVREWIENDVKFEVEYELVEVSKENIPRYIAVYKRLDTKEDFVFISKNWSSHGPHARIFNLWPGVIRHHLEFGDGRPLHVEIHKSKVKKDSKKNLQKRAIFLDD